MHQLLKWILLTANKDLTLHQFDVKNIFLHGDLKDEVYMDILSSFDDCKSTRKVYKLKNTLHNLKQSPRAWFERSMHAMLKWEYKLSQENHTPFIKHSLQGKIAALIVYIDDIVFMGDDFEEIIQLKKSLSNEFEINDLGVLNIF